MPGRLFLSSGLETVGSVLGTDVSQIEDTTPRFNIAPGQQILTVTSNGLEPMRWGIIPVGRVNARGRPVMETLINARSESVFDKSAYDSTGRAVVPVNGWYEWTGKARRKTVWRIRAKDSGLLWFAAITDIWAGLGGLTVPQVATVTCEPNADIAPIHHRMGVLLEQNQIQRWLSGSVQDVIPLMRPWPVGRLHIDVAEDVDWNGA